MATISTDFDTELYMHKCHVCVHAATKFRLSSSFQHRIMNVENGNKDFETPTTLQYITSFCKIQWCFDSGGKQDGKVWWLYPISAY